MNLSILLLLKSSTRSFIIELFNRRIPISLIEFHKNILRVFLSYKFNEISLDDKNNNYRSCSETLTSFIFKSKVELDTWNWKVSERNKQNKRQGTVSSVVKEPRNRPIFLNVASNEVLVAD